MKTENGLYKFDIQLFAGTAFVVDDVLPATTQLKIAWTTDLESWLPNSTMVSTDSYFSIHSLYENSTVYYSIYDQSFSLYESNYYPCCGDSNDQSCSSYKYFILDTSGWSESQRTITLVHFDASTYGLTYEDVATPTWTVTFNSNGGTAVSDITDVEDGATITAPTPAPERENYTFAGWFKEEALTNAWVFASDTVTADTTLYAKWVQGAFEKMKEAGRQIIQKLPKETTSVISVADWSAGTSVTKTVSGVTTTNIVWVSPAPASRAKAVEFDVYASAQGTDEITFTASETPDAEITFNIVIGGS